MCDDVVKTTIRIPPEVHKRLLMERAETGRSIADTILLALREYWERQEKERRGER